MCYTNSTKGFVQSSYRGDTIEDLKLAFFCHADSAGYKSISKGTFGVLVRVAGPTKKQGCISTITCESEVVAMAAGLREALRDGFVGGVVQQVHQEEPTWPGNSKAARIGAQVLMLETEHEVSLVVFADYQTTLAVLETGASKAASRLQRTNRVNGHGLCEIIQVTYVHLYSLESLLQVADIPTKGLVDP